MDDRVVVVSASSRNIAVDEERATSLHGSTTPQCVRYEYHPNVCAVRVPSQHMRRITNCVAVFLCDCALELELSGDSSVRRKDPAALHTSTAGSEGNIVAWT